MMILEPNDNFDEPFEFNMAGIQFTKTSKGMFRIDRVIPNSPASESGLRVDDVVTSINGTSVDYLTHDELNQLMEKEGEKVILNISRGNENTSICLQLRRLI